MPDEKPSEFEFKPTVDESFRMFMNLHPVGRAYGTHVEDLDTEGSPLRQFWRAISNQWVYLEELILKMVDEGFCRFANTDIDGWVHEYTTPGEVDPFLSSICLKVSKFGPLDESEYLAIAVDSGWDVVDLRFLKGEGGVWATLYIVIDAGASDAFPSYATLGTPSFKLGSARLGVPAADEAMDLLYNLFDRAVPAHVDIHIELVTLSAEARAIIDEMVTLGAPPSVERMTLINGTVNDFKAAGVWDKLKVIGFRAAHAAPAGLINWKNPAGPKAYTVNNPVFHTDSGFQCSIANESYLKGNIPVNTLGLSTDNFYISAFPSANHGSTGGQAYMLTASWWIIPRTSGNNFVTRLFEAAANAFAAGVTEAKQHFAARRNNTTDHVKFIDGVAVHTYTAAITAAMPAVDWFEGSSGVAGAFTDWRIGYVAIGEALSDDEVADESAIVTAYMNAIGVI